MLRSKKEALGVLGVVVAIATGATLPIILSTAGAHATAAPVASCSPPGISGSATPVASFSPPCIPALSATPDTGLGDGQSISVTGTGFSANTEIGMAECEPGAVSEADCDISTGVLLESDGSGDFSTAYNVARILNISNGTQTTTQIDCAQVACLLAAADLSDFSVAASTTLSFNPNLPLELSGTLAKKGTVRPHTGTATITGTVTCASPTIVEVDVNLVQFYKRFVFTNEVYEIVPCSSTASTWTAVVPPGNGLYAVGKAQATVYLDAQFGTSYRQIELTGKVNLKLASKSGKK